MMCSAWFLTLSSWKPKVLANAFAAENTDSLRQMDNTNGQLHHHTDASLSRPMHCMVFDR